MCLKSIELLKKIKAEWQRILDSGGSLTPLELIYLEAIDYVIEEYNENT